MIQNRKQNYNDKVNVNDTKIIANDILLFSQIFGGLPLKYTTNQNNKTIIEFSKPLQTFGITYMMCLTALNYAGFFYDYTRYLTGDVFLMSGTMSALNTFADITLLNVTTIVVIVTASRKYTKLLEMCSVLEKVDKSLQQKPDAAGNKLKVLGTFVFTTTVLTWSLANAVFKNSARRIIYLPKVCMYYTQAAVYLLFTFVTGSLTTRFRIINKKIQQEVVRLNLRFLIKDLSLHKTISGNEGSTADEVYILIDSYTQLYEAQQLANSFYQGQLFATVCSSFVHTTLTLYDFLAIIWSTSIVISEWDLFNKGLWALVHTSYLFLLVWPTKSLTLEAGKTAPLACQLLSKNLNDADLRDQLETFLLQLRHYKVEFSALGFFQVNSSLLLLMASSIATYLVILIQLGLDD